MKSTRCFVVSLCVCLVLFAALSSVSILAAQPGSAPALMSQGEGKGLVITTHGSRWFFRDDLWRYPAFKNFEESFDFINRLELDQVLQEFAGLTLGQFQSMVLTFDLTQNVADALVFDLTGTSPDWQGLRLNMTVQAPGGVTYGCPNNISERSLHIDQPALGTYTIYFYTDRGASFSLRVGTGRSPFLSTDLQRYSFLLISDVDPLTSRELAKVRQFVQRGGKLIILSDLIQGQTYFSTSNFPALNPLLAGCGIQFTGVPLTTTNCITANNQRINILTNITPHELTQGITNVLSTGSTLVLTGTAQGLVFDDLGQPAIALGQEERGYCLAVGTGIGFNADFGLRQNNPLAENIMRWARVRVPFVIYLPIVIKSYSSL